MNEVNPWRLSQVWKHLNPRLDGVPCLELQPPELLQAGLQAQCWARARAAVLNRAGASLAGQWERFSSQQSAPRTGTSTSTPAVVWRYKRWSVLGARVQTPALLWWPAEKRGPLWLVRNPWSKANRSSCCEGCVLFSNYCLWWGVVRPGERRVGALGGTLKRKMWFGANMSALEESASRSPLRLGSAPPAHSLHSSTSRLSACGWKWLISASHQLPSFRKMQRLPKLNFKN